MARRSPTQAKLEAGHPIAGLFAPAEADFATPGVLTWSANEGALVQLADLSNPWPTDFDSTFDVHCSPHDGEALTLLDAHVTTMSPGHRTSRISAWTVALGAHTNSNRKWPRSNYRPSALHEWLPETGLSIDHPDEDRSRLVVEWRRPATRTVALPDASVQIRPGADYSWSYAPDWNIETSMTFGVAPAEPQALGEHRKAFGNPMLSFIIFATDSPDDLTRESYFDPETNEGVVVLQRDRRPAEQEWRPLDGRFLFTAADLPDIERALGRWFEVWRLSSPALALFRETIEEDHVYSASRFLTLYTAAEGYWKATKSGRGAWSPRALAQRAGISPSVTGATDDALALIGATRRYHAHLGESPQFSPDYMVETTYESTRRLHALLQACLMREVGFETEDIERLMSLHYRNWPVP